MKDKKETVKSALKYFMPLLLLLAAFLAMPASGLAAEVEHNTLEMGSQAPLFSSFTIDGQPFDLKEELSKKNLVLFFWSFFCSPCREEMPLIQEFYKEIQGKPVEIAGVNLDETALHTPIKNYLKSAGFTYPMVVNKYESSDAKLDKLYKVTGTPTVYMISRDGTIRFTHVGRLEFEDFKKAVEENLLSGDK